jgi:succinate-acetate transporter protein
MESEDIFFIFIFMLLYIGFHAVGVVLIMQDQLISRIIGVFWLVLSIVAFNYGLYKIVKEVCYIREAQVNYQESLPLLVEE